MAELYKDRQKWPIHIFINGTGKCHANHTVEVNPGWGACILGIPPSTIDISGPLIMGRGPVQFIAECDNNHVCSKFTAIAQCAKARKSFFPISKRQIHIFTENRYVKESLEAKFGPKNRPLITETRNLFEVWSSRRKIYVKIASQTAINYWFHRSKHLAKAGAVGETVVPVRIPKYPKFGVFVTNLPGYESWSH